MAFHLLLAVRIRSIPENKLPKVIRLEIEVKFFEYNNL